MTGVERSLKVGTENCERTLACNFCFFFPLTFDGRGRNLQSTVDGTGLFMEKTDLLEGTLDMLILKVLNCGPMHGFGIAERIQRLSEDYLSVGEGSLYPALYRLQQRGWVESEWGQSENNRRAARCLLRATPPPSNCWRRGLAMGGGK